MPPTKRQTPSSSSTPSKTSNTTTTTTTSPNSPTQPTPKPASASSRSSSSSNTNASSSNNPQIIMQQLWSGYLKTTPQRVKLIDAFMGFLVVVGGLQFLYCLVVGNYPFNAFLSGFSATVGQFVLTASLRIQTNPENKAEFKTVSHERLIAKDQESEKGKCVWLDGKKL
ncbi:MAG: hypothetical protein LQ350_005612 [Teloschistes chrysophthalmus]|nr:MAG: hypothetical protein LQ350_005612 [Niorma chrysophthalma]